MKNATIKGLTLIALFFLTWFLLIQIDWVSVFRVKKVTEKTEEKLGQILWDLFEKSENENTNSIVVNSIDSLVNKICSANSIEREFIKVHILDQDDINAFALPNGHLLVYSGLILTAENQEELSGVICHEIAHIQLDHVMKKLVKEVGLSVLISMSTGNGGSEVIKETAKILSSSAFDRKLEKEADIKAVDYLMNAKINPEAFADFLYRNANQEAESFRYFSWISTHPNSKDRAEYIVNYYQNKKIVYKPVLSSETFIRVKEILAEQRKYQ